MKTILNLLNLVPEGETGLHVLSINKKKTKEQTPKNQIQVQVFQQESTLEKRVIKLPSFIKILPTRSVKNLNLPIEYGMTHIGSYGEIWSTPKGCSAIVRRKDSKVTFYGEDSYQKIYSYWSEATKRGLGPVQATDIICNELTRL